MWKKIKIKYTVKILFKKLGYMAALPCSFCNIYFLLSFRHGPRVMKSFKSGSLPLKNSITLFLPLYELELNLV